MKKNFISFLLVVMMLIFISLLSACNKKETQADESADDNAYMAIYQLYVDSSESAGVEPKDYEEWLDSICKPGKDGKDAIAPRIRINMDNNHWEISADGGVTWQDLGVKATGADGVKGENGTAGRDGVSPHIGDNGNWWIGDTDTGVPVTGPAGNDGQNGTDGNDGISPQLRIIDGYWEISYDNGRSWTSLGVAATGPKGEKGDKGDKGDTGEPGKDGNDGVDGQDGVGITEVTIVDGKLIITLSNGNIIDLGNVVGKDGVDGTPGHNGIDGEDGKDGQNGNDGIGIANVVITNNNLIVTLSNGNVIDLGNIKGDKGENGSDGKDGISIVKSEINAQGELVLTYSDGSVKNLGKVVGSDGKDGQNGANGKDGTDGITPQLRINTGTNIWEVSYDNGKTWTSLGISATGPKGDDGEKGDNGENGKDGVGISKIEYDEDGNLVITFTNGSIQTVTMPEKPSAEEHVHNFSEWKKYNSNNINCEQVLLYRICGSCSDIEWREGTYSDHEFITVTTAPTCQMGGYDTKTCTYCGKAEVTNETPASDHSYGIAYETDGSYHWKECIFCGGIAEKGEHSITSSGSCSVCNMPAAPSEGMVYEVSKDGTYATLVAYEGTATKLRIAEEYMGVPVKVIGSNVFTNKIAIVSVVIPDCITTIEDYAFYGCVSLTEIKLPTNLIKIANYAFGNCGFTSLTLPKSVTAIGDYSFEGCHNLSNITLENYTALVGSGAFSNCHASLYTEEGYCKYVAAEDNPYAILAEVTNTNFTSCTINENTKIIAKKAFYNCADITSMIIPDSVVSIGEFAFNSCTSMTTLIVGRGVKIVGNAAFYACQMSAVYYSGTESEWNIIKIDSTDKNNSYLTEPTRYYYSATHPVSDDSFWYMNSGVATVWCYSPVVDKAVDATCSTEGLTEGLHCGICNTVLVKQLPIGASGHNYVDRECTVCGDILYSRGFVFQSNGDGTCTLTSIGDCTDTDLFIPPVSPEGDVVTAIGYGAFYTCDRIVSVTIPGSVSIIEAEAFRACENLARVYMEEGISEVQESAFILCTSLVDLTLPETLTYLGYNSFALCTSLREINYNGTVDSFYWNVYREDTWNQQIGICTLHCSDGDFDVTNENEAA